jgi:hypothetical protein
VPPLDEPLPPPDEPPLLPPDEPPLLPPDEPPLLPPDDEPEVESVPPSVPDAGFPVLSSPPHATIAQASANGPKAPSAIHRCIERWFIFDLLPL